MQGLGDDGLAILRRAREIRVWQVQDVAGVAESLAAVASVARANDLLSQIDE
jgi:hypothetical protein